MVLCVTASLVFVLSLMCKCAMLTCVWRNNSRCRERTSRHLAIRGDVTMATWMSGGRSRVEDGSGVHWRALSQLVITLRANMDQRALLAQVLAATPTITGFQSVAIFLPQTDAQTMELVAENGMTEDERRRIAATPL